MYNILFIDDESVLLNFYKSYFNYRDGWNAFLCSDPTEEQVCYVDVYCLENWDDARYINEFLGHDRPDDEDEWDEDEWDEALEPTLKGNKLIGLGSSDSKGGIASTISALSQMEDCRFAKLIVQFENVSIKKLIAEYANLTISDSLE